MEMKYSSETFVGFQRTIPRCAPENLLLLDFQETERLKEDGRETERAMSGPCCLKFRQMSLSDVREPAHCSACTLQRTDKATDFPAVPE
jgi:hypothetical protein